jgi:ABC-2 type transport system permease protein
MRTWWTVIRTEAKLYLREPWATFFTLVFPLMVLLLFGAIYGNEPEEIFGGLGSMDVAVPAYTAMIIASVGLLGIAIGVAGYREQGVLKRYRATPMRPAVYMSAHVLVNLGMTLVGTILLIVAGLLIYHVQFQGNWLSVLAAFILCTLSFFAAGFVIASLARTARSAQVIGMVLFYPMLFLSGATIPLEVMPDRLQSWAKILPLTHVVTLLKGLWFGESWGQHWVEVAVLAGLLVVGGTVAAMLFRWE